MEEDNPMKRFIAAVFTMSIGVYAHAIPVVGFSDVTDNGGGSYTFTFDTLPGPDIIGADGLTFGAFGIGLTVTGSDAVSLTRDVIQDVPSNGGLGVNGGAFGDNMGSGEKLTFTFDQSIDLLDISLNGLINGDGHQDAANGDFRLIAGGSSITGPANIFDGVGGDDFAQDLVDLNGGFGNINAFDVLTLAREWHGYVESITIRTSQVPEPSVLALFGAGIVGLGFARRSKLTQ
jgi:hypothetical protein